MRWPQGDRQPDGFNVKQVINCMNDADVVYDDPDNEYEIPELVEPEDPRKCDFTLNAVGRNYFSVCNCTDHPCGSLRCGPQQCCHEIECYQRNCCDQILDVDPNTGEAAKPLILEDNSICPWGVEEDEFGNKGGWSTVPDSDGVYQRCKRPLFSCFWKNPNNPDSPEGEISGCIKTPEQNDNTVECNPNPSCFSCKTSGSYESPRGDVLNWTIPRKREFAAQGQYSRHCPDSIEPFVPEPSTFGNETCDRRVAPCPGDPNFCEFSNNNPSGTICNAGLCWQATAPSSRIGKPYHDWPEQPRRTAQVCGEPLSYEFCHKEPIAYELPPGDECNPVAWKQDGTLGNHRPGLCGATPCEDIIGWENISTGEVVYEQPSGQNWLQIYCERCECNGLGQICREGDVACTKDACLVPDGGCCPQSELATWADGYNEDEIGLQLVNISCSPQHTMPIETQAVREGLSCPSEDDPEPRPIYTAERAFQVSLEYKGGGCGASGADLRIYRTGEGRFTLIKNEDEAEQDCLFGVYRHLVDKDAGTSGWFTAGGANPAPYYDPANPGDALYYVGELNSSQGEADCSRPIWHRNRNHFACKFDEPEVYIF